MRFSCQIQAKLKYGKELGYQKISSEDVNKSAAIATFERDSEKSRDFHIHFGLMIDSEDKLYIIIIIIHAYQPCF